MCCWSGQTALMTAVVGGHGDGGRMHHWHCCWNNQASVCDAVHDMQRETHINDNIAVNIHELITAV